jgi:hypothetical protein
MRFLLLALLAFGFSNTAEAKVDCNRHKIYCKIKKLQPRIKYARAMQISNYIYRLARAHNIDPMVSVAILHQENRFRDVHTYEVERDVKEECHATSCVKHVTEHHEVVDLGIAQINVKTAIYHGFDIQRLYDHDTEYAIEAHMVILASKIKACTKQFGEEAWSCYHSVTTRT